VRDLIGCVCRTSGLGGVCASIVYFTERTFLHPFLWEDVTAYVVSAVGVVCLAFSMEFE